MRNSARRNVKRIAAGLLAGMLILTGVYYLPANSAKAYAAGAVDETVVHTEEFYTIEDYVGGAERIAPKPKETGYEEWVFAGWYSDESCKKEYALSSEAKTGKAYAKFVPAELLSVKCQTLAGTTEDRENTQLRLVSTVDNLQYESVGFDIQIGEKKIQYKSQKVCKEIKATETSNSKVEFDCTPKDFHAMADWFTTVTIINIQKDAFSTGIFINPFWTTMDGTTVYGVSRYARVEDSYLNIVNVPVRLYSDAQAAAGYLEVGYDKDICSYVGAESGKGYDIGTVFKEMEAAEKNGVVCCVGNVENIGQNVKTDGMYINLRFKVSDLTKLEKMTFSVSKEQFCDKAENELRDFDVFDVVYRGIAINKNR